MQIVKRFQRRGTPRLQIIERRFMVDLNKATHIEVNSLTEREEVVVKELGAGVDVVETVERRLPITEIEITLPPGALTSLIPAA